MIRKSKSIREHIVLPILVIMLIQAVLFLTTMLYGSVADGLKANSIEVLDEYTKNSKLYMEKEIVNRWMKEMENTGALEDTIEAVLQDQGKDLQDIRKDSELNGDIIFRITPQVIELLHRSYATGVFVILDGPAAANSKEGIQSGVYIRDLNPGNYAQDNSDLLLERGLPSLANKYGIALDSFWDLGFDFRDRNRGMDYYFKPFESAQQHQAKKGMENNFAYMSPPFSLHSLDSKVISYSKPLVLKDYGVIGVIGIDMTLAQLQSYIRFDREERFENNISLLGIREKGSSQIKMAATVGPLYERFWGTRELLDMKYDEESKIYQLSSDDGELWYGGVYPLDIYNLNTPFEKEEWVFVNLSRERDVLRFYEKMRGLILVSLALPLILGTCCIVITGRMLAQPIRNMVIEMRGKKSLENLKLRRVNIDEIDELAEAIETLSKDVAEGSMKITHILDSVNIPIGVFEYKEKFDRVFCSRSLFEIMNWEEIEEEYVYLDASVFKQKMQAVGFLKMEKETDIYYVDNSVPKWYNLKIVDQDGDYLGVLSDVTSEMLERRKLEKERDYDLLTNLFNRRAFQERVQDRMALLPGDGAMVMWDLDNLKYINDTYGHDEGDRYIMLFAERLKLLEKDGGIISRYAGDEFLSFLYDNDGKEGVRRRLKEFMESLRECTMEFKGGYNIPLRVSGGISWFPEDETHYELLVTYADFAMYMVKHNKKGILMEFDREQYQEDSYLIAGKEELNQILEEKKMKFAFQPIVAQSGELYGYEILMRPKGEKLKSVTELLNLAKSQAKLSQVESLTWTEGMRAVKSMRDQGFLGRDVHVFLNSISSVRMTEAEVLKLEQDYRDFLDCVVVELTEGEPMSQRCMKHKLAVANRWNAQIAIDDYGSGYNSEAVLLEIRPDIVKLDMGMVRNIDKDITKQLLVKGMVDFAKAQNIRVLGEGVETFDELSTLIKLNVDLFQGYYIGHPEEEIRPVDPYIVQKIKSMFPS